MPPSEEMTTRLSREPWASGPQGPDPWGNDPWGADPQAQPGIWQPPAPPQKNKTPYIVAAVGAVLLLGVALGIVLWPSGSQQASPSGGDIPAAQGQQSEPAPETDEPVGPDEPSGDFEGQAGAVDALLGEMGSTRSELGRVVAGGCQRGGLQRVLEMRKGQLERARQLDVGALSNGTPMKNALVRALEASTESNQRYLAVAPRCPTDAEVADVNGRASSAKEEFLGYWASVAEQAGLPARTEGDI